jgi:hypothetical protein
MDFVLFFQILAKYNPNFKFSLIYHYLTMFNIKLRLISFILL